MVDAIEGTVQRWKISELFIGAVIIPIVGNAAGKFVVVAVVGVNEDVRTRFRYNVCIS